MDSGILCVGIKSCILPTNPCDHGPTLRGRGHYWLIEMAHQCPPAFGRTHTAALSSLPLEAREAEPRGDLAGTLWLLTDLRP